MRKQASPIAYIGMFTALACIMSYIEVCIPFSLGIPGVKLGLANIVIVFALYFKNGKTAFLVSLLRIALVSFLFANLAALLYSLAGGLVSLGVMCLLKKSGKFSILGVSIAGGVFHNIGQLLMAMVVLETFSLGGYLPVLLISGTVTGILIGWLAGECLKRIKRLF